MRKKIIIGAIIAVSAVVLIVASFAFWLTNQMRDLKAVDTARLSDSVYVVKGSIGNMFLVGRSGSFVAFDAGDNSGAIAKGLASLGIAADSVRAVFLTHSDADHTGAVPLFRNAKVYLSKKEVALLDGTTPRHFLMMTTANKLPVPAYETLNDGDSVVVGPTTIHAISTPGHTAGSMCFRVGEMLFTGDLCILKGGAIEPMLKIFTEDMAMDSVSIREVAKRTNIRSVYTAHTGMSSDFADAFVKWR